MATTQEVVTSNGHHDDDATPVGKPPDIEQDIKSMEHRKRVEMIMNSQVFREELERIVESQLQDGYMPGTLFALQQVTELLPSSARNSQISRLGNSGMPINDIRGVDAFRYAKGEKFLRCKLASTYRLVDLYGWSQGIYNHITVRVSQDHEHFLLNPFGLQYHEITASSLLKVDMQGNTIDPGTTNFTFNRPGFVLHSAIHAARPDLKAVIHLHHAPCVAISALKCGLLHISQESAIIGDISYFDYSGLLIDGDERQSIARALGPINKVLILRNHGVVTCGESLEEALFLMHNVVLACESQIRLAPLGLENLTLLSEEAVEQVRATVRAGAVHGKPEQGMGAGTETAAAPAAPEAAEKKRKWKIWDIEFEAQMRMLDNAGFRTGFLYRQPLLRVDQQKLRFDDVEVPSAAHSAGLFDEDKWLSPLRKLVDGKRTQDKLRWVNSPNTYKREELLETGTNDPKKITRWIPDGSPTHQGTTVKIDNAHQFVPVSANPKEFKEKQRLMKEIRMKNMVSSGPQSHILDGGVTWEEMKRMEEGSNTETVLVGAASKGIIQKEYQLNAQVYKTAYAKNPFDNITDEELEQYRLIVAAKQRGEDVEVPENVRHLLIDPVDKRGNRITSPTSPTSPLSDDEARRQKKEKGNEPKIVITNTEASRSGGKVHRSHSARMAAQGTTTEPTTTEPTSESQKSERTVTAAAEEDYFQRRYKSERKYRSRQQTSDSHVNGEGRSSSRDDADRKKKKEKKEKGFRTPSFLKSKKKTKKEPEAGQ